MDHCIQDSVKTGHPLRSVVCPTSKQIYPWRSIRLPGNQACISIFTGELFLDGRIFRRFLLECKNPFFSHFLFRGETEIPFCSSVACWESLQAYTREEQAIIPSEDPTPCLWSSLRGEGGTGRYSPQSHSGQTCLLCLELLRGKAKKCPRSSPVPPTTALSFIKVLRYALFQRRGFRGGWLHPTVSDWIARQVVALPGDLVETIRRG